ncbi:MAG: 50S ribosomal protein L4 [Rhodoglobus sp.]|nr:50S ribosomal protein L4 [Rhodoglobus sp.]
MANTLDVVDTSGKKTGSVELPASIFDVQTNVPLIHQVVVAQLAVARQGTHKTKGRGEVSGSGRKPFKQKGTGRARQGSVRMPQHRGGGTVHGPQPRDYSQRTPKKMIAEQGCGERLTIVDSFGKGDAPSTKGAAALLSNVTGKNILVVLERGDELGYKSVRNLRNLHVLWVDQLNAYDVIVSDDVVFTKAAYESFVASKSSSTSKEEASA